MKVLTRPKHIPALIFAFSMAIMVSCSKGDRIYIQIDKSASPTLQFAASELADKLTAIYPDTKFKTKHGKGFGKRAIHIQVGNNSSVRRIEINPSKQVPGAFSIQNDDEVAVISGFDEEGVLQGVYRMLEKLGYDFHLSYDITPQPREQFNFEDWTLWDFPLKDERIVFNWHNFLSGCTGWDLEDWKKWMLQSVKLGFNTMMIHTYGNNPITSFEHNGVQKPVGYLSTTVSGRDWGTEHVNDIRRLIGGEIFDQPVFGSSAALVDDSLRVRESQKLMQEVFAYADQLGMKINFAFDIDTRSANPQEIIQTLPNDALITAADGFQIANPETKEGFNYYRSQVETFLETYPQIDRLIFWTRKYNPNPYWLTPLRSLTPEQFPRSWKSEYEKKISDAPGIREDIYAPSTFVVGKITSACIRVLEESGSEVEVGSGSWEFGFLPSADHFLAPEVALYPLDFKVTFEDTSSRRQLLEAAGQRRMVPIVWAHHDDHRYMGKPYTPYENFHTKLTEAGGSGFGIIHWLTRPLDIYFKSLSRQTWNATVNESIVQLNGVIADKLVPDGSPLFEEYLNDWIQNAPMFGRETSDFLMDPGTFIIGELPTDPDTLLDGISRRLKLLQQLKSKQFPSGVMSSIDFYEGLETFFLSFITQQNLLYQSNRAWKEGQHLLAQELIAEATPERTIKAFAALNRLGTLTKGEQALIISMNLRWLPDFINQKQLVRLEPIRYNFQPTSHDPLAQAPGYYSFMIDNAGDFWIGLGEAEIEGVQAVQNKEEASSIFDNYIRSDSPFSLMLKTMRGEQLSPGNYKLIIHPLNSSDGSVEVQIRESDILILNKKSDTGNNKIELEFTAKGDPIKLNLNPLGHDLGLAGMEIIPIDE